MGYPQKIGVIILLFYFFALLQNSFLVHFSFFGAVPNLVFILFFLLAFFEKKHSNLYIIFLAITAGFCMDILFYSYMGPSIITLLILGFLMKKVQLSLKNSNDEYPFVYFAPLFIFCLLFFDFVLNLYNYYFESALFLININLVYTLSTFCNIFVAFLFFYLYKRFFRKKLY